MFVWAFAPRPRLLVFGAIDFAAAVARVGGFLGYQVTVCDARPVFATASRFPGADEVVVDWPHRYLEAERDAGRIDGRTVITVLTHDPKFDVPLLEVALRLPDVAYVGAMGSRRTHDDRLERLREAGLTDAELERLLQPDRPRPRRPHARGDRDQHRRRGDRRALGRHRRAARRPRGPDPPLMVRLAGLVMALVLLASCSDATEPEEPADAAAPSSSAPSSPSPTPSPTAEPEPTPTLPPVHHPVSLPALMREDFRASRIRQQRVVAETDAYTRSEVTYRSGDLTISGVLLRPHGRGPFPGDRAQPRLHRPLLSTCTGQGLAREQDWLARAGFVVLHTDYRGHAGSDPAAAAGPRGPARLRPRRDDAGRRWSASCTSTPTVWRCSAGRWAAG